MPGALLAAILLLATRSAAQAVAEPALPPSLDAFGLEYSHVQFQGGYSPWNFGSASVIHRDARGSLIGRVNYANRFGESGVQVEGDAYPRLGRSTYAYVNLGYSASNVVFPQWRSGLELFTNLPSAWEGSLGVRQLRFGGAPVTLLTGTVGKYVGNYWFSLRPYVNAGKGSSASASLSARRYYADGDHYIGARIGGGSAPADQVTVDALALARTTSVNAAILGSGGLADGLLGTWSLSYERETLALSRHREGWTFSTGLRFGM